MTGLQLLYLARADVQRCLPTMSEMIDLMEEVFYAHADGRAQLPDPTKLFLNLRPAINGNLTAIPGYLRGRRGAAAGLKWLSNFPDNPRQGSLPSITAINILNDPQTGRPLAIMEGTLTSAFRTGAASGVAIRRLRRPGRNVAALVGASAQGRYQVRAAAAAADLEEIRVYDLYPEASEALVREMAPELGVPMRAVATEGAAVDGADLVIIATTAKQPHFREEWCRPGTLIVNISAGADLFPEVIRRADKIVVDDREGPQHIGCLAPSFASGELSLADVHADLGELVTGRKPGRESPDEMILCVPMGMGTEDVAAADFIYRRALELGVGAWLPFF